MKSVVLTCFFLLGVVVAEVTVVPERLTLDGVFRGDALFWQGSEKGWAKSGFGFYNRLAALGINGVVVKNVNLRVDYDFAQLALRDLFMDFRWTNGLQLRAGQFVLPLSFEAEAPEEMMKLDDYSLFYSTFNKPTNPRDIGLMLSYENPCSSATPLRVMGMLVNGTGPNSGDNNSWKDVCGRLVFKPKRGLDLLLGGALYYGWVFPEGVRLLSFAGEWFFRQSPVTLLGRVSYRRFRNVGVPAGYAELSADLGFFEPAARLEAIRWEEENLQWRGSAGVNLKVFPRRLQVFIGYQYHTLVNSWIYQGITARLKATL